MTSLNKRTAGQAVAARVKTVNRPIALALATTMAFGGLAVAPQGVIGDLGIATASAAELDNSIVNDVTYTFNGEPLDTPVTFGIDDNAERRAFFDQAREGALRLKMSFNIPNDVDPTDTYLIDLKGVGFGFKDTSARTVAIRNDEGVRVADMEFRLGGKRATLTNFNPDAGIQRTVNVDLELYGGNFNSHETGEQKVLPNDEANGKYVGLVETLTETYGVAGFPVVESTYRVTWVENVKKVSNFTPTYDWGINASAEKSVNDFAYIKPLGVGIGTADVRLSGGRATLDANAPATRTIDLTFVAAPGATLRDLSPTYANGDVRDGIGFGNFEVFRETPRVTDTETSTQNFFYDTYKTVEEFRTATGYNPATWGPVVTYSPDRTSATVRFSNVPSDVGFDWNGIEAVERFNPGATFVHRASGSVGEPAASFDLHNYFDDEGFEWSSNRHPSDLFDGDGTLVGDPNLTDKDGNPLETPDDGEDGAPGNDGADGSNGADGTVVTVVDDVVDGEGNRTITFSDGTSITLGAGADGANGTALTIVSVTSDERGQHYVLSDGSRFTVPNGVDGVDGSAATVVRTSTDVNGNHVVELSDGTVLNITAGVDGSDGVDGLPGSGMGIAYSYVDVDGNTVVVFDNGQQFTITQGDKGDKGETGDDGADGVAIDIVGLSEDAAGNLIIEFSDGRVVTIPVGETGAQGQIGAGITIESVTTDAAGNSVYTLSDGTVFTVAKGDKGDKGETGDPGSDGADGTDGKAPTSVDEITNPDGSVTVVLDDGSTITTPAHKNLGEGGILGFIRVLLEGLLGLLSFGKLSS